MHLYVKDINSVFKNVEFIVKKGELTKELYSIASFLFTEKDRQKELIDRNKLTSKISGSLYDNIIYKWLEDDYNKIYELCQKNNSKLVFVNYFESPMPVMKKVAEDKDIIFVDIYSYLKENINRKDEYKSLFQTDGHLTGKGNELTANIIYKTIEDEL